MHFNRLGHLLSHRYICLSIFGVCFGREARGLYEFLWRYEFNIIVRRTCTFASNKIAFELTIDYLFIFLLTMPTDSLPCKKNNMIFSCFKQSFSWSWPFNWKCTERELVKKPVKCEWLRIRRQYFCVCSISVAVSLRKLTNISDCYRICRKQSTEACIFYIMFWRWNLHTSMV